MLASVEAPSWPVDILLKSNKRSGIKSLQASITEATEVDTLNPLSDALEKLHFHINQLLLNLKNDKKFGVGDENNCTPNMILSITAVSLTLRLIPDSESLSFAPAFP